MVALVQFSSGMEEEEETREWMSFDHAELQVPVKHPRKGPRNNWNTCLKLGETDELWRDVGVRSVEKMVEVMGGFETAKPAQPSW